MIIPTFKPGDKLENFCGGCWNRVCRWVDVIIMNTEEKYWDAERFESLFEGKIQS